jgi:hypothetical protein
MSKRIVMNIYELIDVPRKRWQFWLPKQVKVEILSYFNCEITEIQAQQVKVRLVE